MVKIECQNCNTIFEVAFKYRKQKFCSKKCFSTSRIICIECRICGNSFKSSLNRHTCSESCSNELKKITNKQAGIKRKGRLGARTGKIPWNKGLTKETDERVLKSSETAKQGFIDNPNRRVGRKHSKEALAKLRANAGGLRQGSGRGKSGWYKGFWCDSTYELVWLIYNLDAGNAPVRNTSGYLYEWEGKEHRYYPDFILDDVIYEIKGYQTPKDFEKYKSIKNKKLVVLLQKDLELEFAYVQETYKYKSLADLYDKSKFKGVDYFPTWKDLCHCGKSKCKQSSSCKDCTKRTTKIEWPDIDTLKQMLSNSNYVQVGKLLGVTDNTIRKHIKALEIRSCSSDVEHSVEAGSVADSRPAMTIDNA